MALRYKIQSKLADVNPVYPELPAPVFRKGKTFEFRRGENMREFASSLLTVTESYVDAATAAGKSVRLPSAITMVSKKRVFHVTPGNLLALDLSAYVKKCANEDLSNYPTMEYVDESMEMPETGLVFISAVTLISWLLRAGVTRSLAGSILFLDEAHESDAYTYTLRTLGRNFGASHVILASATLGATGFQKQESPGHVQQIPYSSEMTPETWDLSDPKLPWRLSRLQGNLLVFTDSVTQARTIADKYRRVGLQVFRLTANMHRAEFERAMVATRDLDGPIIALIADYSFRSGFTFDVSTIVDVGRVLYTCDDNGSIRRRSRRLFEFERVQTAGRGGRLTGAETKYYYPDLEYDSVIVELEGVEAEAAALLYRAFGYAPSGILSNCVMCNVNPHMPLGHSLAAEYPLALMLDETSRNPNQHVQSTDSVTDTDSAPEEKISFVPKTPVKKYAHAITESDHHDPGVSSEFRAAPSVVSMAPTVDIGRGNGVASDIQSVNIDATGQLCGENAVKPIAALEYLKTLAGCKTELAPVEELFGLFLFSDNMTTNNPRSSYQDINHVYKTMDKLGASRMKQSLSTVDRGQVVGLLCNEYNMTAVKITAGIRTANTLRDKSLAENRRFSPRVARDALNELFAEKSVLQVQFDELVKLSGHAFPLRAMPFPDSVTDKITADMVQEYIKRMHWTKPSMSAEKYISDLTRDYDVDRRIQSRDDRRISFSSKSSSSVSMHAKLPWWMGIKSIDYKAEDSDEIIGKRLKPGRELRQVSGRSAWHTGREIT